MYNNIIIYKKKLFNFRLDFGIGFSKFKFFLLKLGLKLNNGIRRFFRLKLKIIQRYKLVIFLKKWKIVQKLKYRFEQYLVFLKKIKNYKYLRFKYGLPVNGQRTHSNRKNTFKGLISFLNETNFNAFKQRRLRKRRYRYKKPSRKFKMFRFKKFFKPKRFKKRINRKKYKKR